MHFQINQSRFSLKKHDRNDFTAIDPAAKKNNVRKIILYPV